MLGFKRVGLLQFVRYLTLTCCCYAIIQSYVDSFTLLLPGIDEITNCTCLTFLRVQNDGRDAIL